MKFSYVHCLWIALLLLLPLSPAAMAQNDLTVYTSTLGISPGETPRNYIYVSLVGTGTWTFAGKNATTNAPIIPVSIQGASPVYSGTSVTVTSSGSPIQVAFWNLPTSSGAGTNKYLLSIEPGNNAFPSQVTFRHPVTTPAYGSWNGQLLQDGQNLYKSVALFAKKTTDTNNTTQLTFSIGQVKTNTVTFVIQQISSTGTLVGVPQYGVGVTDAFGSANCTFNNPVQSASYIYKILPGTQTSGVSFSSVSPLTYPNNHSLITALGPVN